MKPDIYMISLGCPRNLVDSEVLTGALKEKGFRIHLELNGLYDKSLTGSTRGAPRVGLINTCGFIEDAKSESIDTILELAALKKEGKLARIVVTGCLSQRYAKDLMEEIGEIDAIFGSGTFADIPEYMGRIMDGEKVIFVDKEPRFLYDAHMPRIFMTPQHSAYVKVQEGCINFCSYCVIPKIKGPYRSRDMESLLEEVSGLKRRGAKEINVIGQDTTLYGFERYKKPLLGALLQGISRIMKNGWVRLLYTHPAHYNRQLIDVVRNEPSICKYLDLPIQHINDRILKKMNRRITRKDIISLIGKLRRSIPNLAIRTSIIVGFPGETEKDVDELERFIKEVRFERLGVFTYSREEGTPAYDFPGQISDREKESRKSRIMEAQQDISLEKNSACLGKSLKVLIDEKDPSLPGQYIARTEHDAPEVDGTVHVKSKKELKAGDFVNVRIEDVLEYDLVGSV